MKNLLTILLLSSCFIINAQKDIEIKGTVVNYQNTPISSASVSIPVAFLRTATTDEGKFNLSLANVNYKMDDVIKISSNVIDETFEITIGDYIELDNKKIVVNDGSLAIENPKKTIESNKKESRKYTEAKKTSLVLNNVKKGNLITIKNYRGKVFFEEFIEIDNLLNKAFDLNFLNDGSYFFEIEKDLQTEVIPFTVNYDEGIIYLKNLEATLFKPHVIFENELVKINQISPNREPITIDIYDNSETLLYTETVENEQVIMRGYKLEKGLFKIVIKSNSKEYATLIDNLD